MTPPHPPYRVAVIGGGAAAEEERETARRVGAALAEAGAVLICGGLGGVMEAAASGARRAGGLTVGLLPGAHPGSANPSILLPLATGMGEARNALVVRSAEAVIAVGGGWGTLSEIALARKMGRDVVVLGRPAAPGLGLMEAESPEAAVQWALTRAERGREDEA